MMELVGVGKRYGEIEALNDVSLEVRRGEVLTILGPNGSGKTTLLKIMAALEAPTGGEILLEGVRLDEGNRAGLRRRSTMVFQRTVLLRGTVHDNAAYGLRQGGTESSEVDSRVSEALELVGLGTLADRRARTLSGGQQKRLSLARAIALDRDLLLLDEPLANLDPESLSIVREAIGGLYRDSEATVVMATHNLREAEAISDRLVLLEGGRIVEAGRAAELFGAPSTAMARFSRSENVFTGEASNVGGVSLVDIGGDVVVRAALAREGRTTIHVRPEDIIVSLSQIESSARNTLRGRIVGVEERGAVVRLRVDVGRVFTVQITRRSLDEMGLNVGSEVHLTFKASSVELL